MKNSSGPALPEIPTCASCLKPEALCVCAETPALKPRIRVLILQHPQEPDQELGTARIAHKALTNSLLKVGLSWANLKAATGDPKAEPARWAVLYWGSGPHAREEGAGHKAPRLQPGIHFVDKKSVPLERPPAGYELDGLVVIDGSWSQAKALWWRNAWLLKLKRAVLIPDRPSLYGKLRREPRRETLSTIEATAFALQSLGEAKKIRLELDALFTRFLTKVKEQAKLLLS